MARTIQSPGVQISEVDLSLRANLASQTNVLIPGFAPKGPSSDPIQVSTLSEFEQIYGTPTNAAERYFYQTVKAAFQSPANITCYRIPYGTGAGLGYSSQYSALVYPVITTNTISGQLSSSTFNALTAAGLVATALGPVGTTFAAAYSAQYPSIWQSGLSAATQNATVNVSVTSVNLNYAASASNITYFFGAPTHISLTESDYLAVLRGSAFTWSTSSADPSTVSFAGGTSGQVLSAATPTATFNSLSSLGQAGLIVLNKSQAAINSRFEGTYIGIVDNTALNPATQFDDFNAIQSVNTNGFIPPTSYINVPSQRLTFSLSATTLGANGSVSEVAENIATFDTSTVAFNDTINLGVFKLRQSVFSPDTIQLDYVLQEGYNGSFDFNRQINNPNGGPATSYFLGNVDDSSSNIVTLVNPYISNKNSTSWLNLSGTPNKSVRFLNSARSTTLPYDVTTSASDTFAARMGTPSTVYSNLVNQFGTTSSLVALGDYTVENVSTKVIGDVPTKVNNMLNLMDNSDLYPLSIVCEAGLGTVYANSFNPTTSGYFDDSVPYTGTDFNSLTAQDGSGASAAIVLNYKAVASQFVNFTANKRKDHLFIADPLTNIFVQNGVKTLDDPTKDFSTNIYWPLYNQFSFINNSYTAVYANAVQVPDQSSSRLVWVPFSGFAAAIMANTDANYQPWTAPAGFRRGVVNGVTDVAIYPKQKQRDQLYKISLNPIAFFPNEGYVVYGQKTMSKIPSAFDRINVRRLFLTLENQTNAVARNYVFEPNTLFTRTQVKNVLTPIFDNAKNTAGLYDYMLICDERNNTPSVIDDNSLVVDIYIKPVRTAEFILVNFYATRTNQNFSEIVS